MSSAIGNDERRRKTVADDVRLVTGCCCGRRRWQRRLRVGRTRVYELMRSGDAPVREDRCICAVFRQLRVEPSSRQSTVSRGVRRAG